MRTWQSSTQPSSDTERAEAEAWADRVLGPTKRRRSA